MESFPARRSFLRSSMYDIIGVSIVDVGFKKEVARALLSKELDVLTQKRGIVVEYNFWIHTWIR